MEESVLQKRIKDLLEVRSMSQNEVSRRATGSLGSVRDILSGKTGSPRYDTLASIAKVLNVSVEFITGSIDTYFPEYNKGTKTVNVVGTVAAGTWVEAEEFMDEPLYDVEAVADSRFPNHDYIGFEVSGDSMDEIAAPGSIAICVPWADTGMEPQDGMVVVAAHLRDEGALIERTIKKLKRASTGWILMPMSSNPKHKPIKMSGNGEVQIIGLPIQITSRVSW